MPQRLMHDHAVRALWQREFWLLQKPKKLGEAGEAPPKPLPQWKVSEVRSLEEALLQHGEERTATTRKAVGASASFSYCYCCLSACMSKWNVCALQ